VGEHRWGRGKVGAALVAVVVGAAGCGGGGSGATGAADQAYLAEVHSDAPGVGSLRSDTDLVRLGHVVCDDFSAKASYEEVADRLSLEAGSSSLPAADLGAVIVAAADNYCPQFRDLVS
jgi:hypothetical protein